MLRIFKSFLFCLIPILLLADDYQIQHRGNTIIVFSLKENPVNPAVIIPQNKTDETLIQKTYAQGNAKANAHNVVLIKNPKFIALIDTGYSNTRDILKQKLKSNGVEFNDVTHIILTHAHPDHIGALMEENPFANAEILIDKEEYDFWINGERENIKNTLKSLKNLSFLNHKASLIHKDSGIMAIPMYGHTPGHNVIQLTQDFIFAADIFHAYDVQIKNPKIAVTYDSNKEEAIAAREEFLRTYKGFSFVGTHTPFTAPVVLE